MWIESVVDEHLSDVVLRNFAFACWTCVPSSTDVAIRFFFFCFFLEGLAVSFLFFHLSLFLYFSLFFWLFRALSWKEGSRCRKVLQRPPSVVDVFLLFLCVCEFVSFLFLLFFSASIFWTFPSRDQSRKKNFHHRPLPKPRPLPFFSTTVGLVSTRFGLGFFYWVHYSFLQVSKVFGTAIHTASPPALQ